MNVVDVFEVADGLPTAPTTSACLFRCNATPLRWTDCPCLAVRRLLCLSVRRPESRRDVVALYLRIHHLRVNGVREAALPLHMLHPTLLVVHDVLVLVDELGLPGPRVLRARAHHASLRNATLIGRGVAHGHNAVQVVGPGSLRPLHVDIQISNKCSKRTLSPVLYSSFFC